MIYIAIDPGVTNGFVMVDTMKKERFMKGLTFWKTIERINFYKERCRKGKDTSDIKIFVEDPNFNKPLFPKKYDKDHVAQALRMAQNVGMNKQLATCILDYCKVLAVPVQALEPHQGGKIDGPAFEQQTGIVTNQHCRDAYMILVRKNVIPFNKAQFFNFVS